MSASRSSRRGVPDAVPWPWTVSFATPPAQPGAVAAAAPRDRATATPATVAATRTTAARRTHLVLMVSAGAVDCSGASMVSPLADGTNAAYGVVDWEPGSAPGAATCRTHDQVTDRTTHPVSPEGQGVRPWAVSTTVPGATAVTVATVRPATCVVRAMTPPPAIENPAPAAADDGCGALRTGDHRTPLVLGSVTMSREPTVTPTGGVDAPGGGAAA